MRAVMALLVLASELREASCDRGALRGRRWPEVAAAAPLVRITSRWGYVLDAMLHFLLLGRCCNVWLWHRLWHVVRLRCPPCSCTLRLAEEPLSVVTSHHSPIKPLAGERSQDLRRVFWKSDREHFEGDTARRTLSRSLIQRVKFRSVALDLSPPGKETAKIACYGGGSEIP